MFMLSVAKGFVEVVALEEKRATPGVDGGVAKAPRCPVLASPPGKAICIALDPSAQGAFEVWPDRGAFRAEVLVGPGGSFLGPLPADLEPMAIARVLVSHPADPQVFTILENTWPPVPTVAPLGRELSWLEVAAQWKKLARSGTGAS
jgi:hypothetical protein